MEKENKYFSDAELELLASKFQILSQSSRLKILRAILTQEQSVTDIIKLTGMMQSNVSKQLKMLYEAGIVSCKQRGLMRYYKLSDETVLQICSILCKTIKK